MLTCCSCKLDGSSNRWKKTPSPTVNSFVAVEGFISHVHTNSAIGITISHLVLSVGGPVSHGSAPSASTLTPSGKRRRFNAAPVAPTTTAPIASTSGTSSNTPAPIPAPENDSTVVDTDVDMTSASAANPSKAKGKGKRKADVLDE